jgi:ribonuclease HII
MSLQPDHLLLDAFKLPWVALPQKAIIRGDSACISIAAASIVAKVTRDHIMRDMDAGHPGWGFSQHKGYGTRYHSASIERLGVAPIHRRSFAPIRAALMGQFAAPEAIEQEVEEQMVVA